MGVSFFKGTPQMIVFLFVSIQNQPKKGFPKEKTDPYFHVLFPPLAPVGLNRTPYPWLTLEGEQKFKF